MAAGRESLAREYAQLWDIIVSALEQCAAILGDTEMDMEGFGRLFTLMLSRYDVGVIPVSLDRVSAGDFDRMRRRNIKHLIVLGVSDERLPAASGDTGIFSDEERKRLGTDSVDFYLMHMLSDVSAWEKLRSYGAEEWIAEKKAAGQIRNIGFSFHGGTEAFLKVLNAYDWDFCQIQYNYLDEHTQAGREGLLYAESKGIPVIIMEPLRGGRLVQLLPEEAKLLFAEAVPKRTPAEWAFRWLWNQTGVTVVLSGMNSLEMVQQNVQVASESKAGELTGEQMELYEKVRQEINRKIKVGCTACGYCMPCQKGIDIPGTFRCYNELYTGSRKAGKKEYLMTTAFRKKQNPASGCAQCGKCEQHCPQHIEIRRELKAAAVELETVKYKFMKTAIGVLKLW